MNLADVVKDLRIERGRLANELERVDAALAALGSLNGRKVNGRRKRRTMSAAARAKIAAAQRARWAKVKSAKAK
jgi:hypothetical protein